MLLDIRDRGDRCRTRYRKERKYKYIVCYVMYMKKMFLSIRNRTRIFVKGIDMCVGMLAIKLTTYYRRTHRFCNKFVMG